MIAAFITLSKFLQRKARAKPKKPDLQAPGRPKKQKNVALAALRLPAPDGHGHRTPGPQACKPGWLRWTPRALPESVPHWPGRPADGPCLLRAQLFLRHAAPTLRTQIDAGGTQAGDTQLGFGDTQIDADPDGDTEMDPGGTQIETGGADTEVDSEVASILGAPEVVAGEESDSSD